MYWRWSGIRNDYRTRIEVRNKSLFLELISVLLLIFACIIGWFDIPSTLFYISCEVIISTLLIGVLYTITNRAERLLGIITVLAFISVLVFFTASIPAILTNTYHVEDSFFHVIPEYLTDMLMITWPLLTIRVGFGVFNLTRGTLDVKQKEANLFQNLVILLFTSLGIGLLCVFLYRSTSYIETSVILTSLLVARFIAFIYTNKQEIKNILNKKSPDSI